MTLPTVKKETVTNIVNSSRDKDYEDRLVRLIQLENPLITKLLKYVIDSKDYSKDFKTGYTKAMLQLYDCLRTQIEINELEEQWNGETK